MNEETIIKVNSKHRKAELLPMRGEDAAGNLWTVDNVSFMKNGRRFLPIMGEFHFSRWEPEEWEEAIRKMRAGGVEIVATYIFWIHHEERENCFDFTGCRDLHRFLEVCKKVQMPVWLRIGPWEHGECRNGGFPDWLLSWAKENNAELRSNDPEYLTYVRRYWGQLAKECEGEMCGDGGPVIGIQLENEFGHVGGTQDKKAGAEHMLTLKKMAQEAGFHVPYYTATGWGGAHVVDGEMLPVLGDYVDAPWAQSVEEIPASEVFLFMPFHNDENIGSDAEHEGDGFRFSVEKNPYLTAELGAGMQVTGHRRTFPWPEDVEACALCKLGSGANLLGYYMYHGGINPDGFDQSLEEVPGDMGYNYLPKKNYDFQTCIRESGEISERFGRLKKIHLFTEDFGERMAGMITVLPETLPSSPEDMDTLRASVRVNPVTGEGFLFVNNHQRRRTMKAHRDETVRIVFPDDEIVVEHLNVESDACGIVPFGIPANKSYPEDTENAQGAEDSLRLLRTNAWLLCRLGDRIVFYTDEENRETLYFEWSDGKSHDDRLILLTREEANRAFRVGDTLWLTARTESCILQDCKSDIRKDSENVSNDMDSVRLKLLTRDLKETLTVIHADGSRETVEADRADVGNIDRVNDMKSGELSSECIGEVHNEEGRLMYREYRVYVDTYPSVKFHQLYLDVSYRGDRAELYDADGKLIDDWFTTGEPWHIRLKRFGYPRELVIRVYDSENILPCEYGDHVYYDLEVKPGCALDTVRLIPEYRLELSC